MQNLFWPIYKNLEKEVLTLAEYIHFSDDQINVYSLHIANLILRCSVEIEAISKELYCSVGGNINQADSDGKKRDLYFDTDCLNLLEEKWKLSQKAVSITSINFFFQDAANLTITPLHNAYKRGSSGCKWKQSYQAIKHDRRNSIKKATIENLLYSLGALFILNLYYKNEPLDLGRIYMSDHNFDSRVGSEIFSVFSYSATMLSMSTNMDDSNIVFNNAPDVDRSIYILKYAEQAFIDMHKNFCLDSKITQNNFNSSPEIKMYLAEHPDCVIESINKICMDAGCLNLLSKIISHKYTQQEKNGRMEAIVNKYSNIYPSVSLTENNMAN